MRRYFERYGPGPDRSDKRPGILAFIREHIVSHGYAPNLREIQMGCGISSTSVVDYNLRSLRESGLISYQRGLARSIVLTRQPGMDSAEQLLAELWSELREQDAWGLAGPDLERRIRVYLAADGGQPSVASQDPQGAAAAAAGLAGGENGMR